MEIRPEEVWQSYNLDELQQGINQLFPRSQFSLTEIMELLWSGDFTGVVKYLFEGTIGLAIQELGAYRDILLLLLLLGIASSILNHFVEIFDRHQIADLAYYFIYLLFAMILLRCFEQSAQIAKEVLENIVLFVQLLVPTYLLAVGVAGGLVTAGAYSQVFVMVVYGVESFLKGWVLDFISAYVMLSMINGIWIEEKLKLIIDFLHKLIITILKGSLWIVTGFTFFQGLITPVVDTAKNSMLQKVMGSIPGIGDVTEGVMQLVLGSALIIKNSIGILLLLLLLLLCAVPLLKMLAIAWMLRLAAALLGLVSDKRLVSCTNNMGEGCMLLFRAVGTAMLLFIILLSLIAVSTGRMG